jgi:hypothetical protein
VSGTQRASSSPSPANDPTDGSAVAAEISSALARAGVGEDDPIRPVFAGLIELFERVREEAKVVKETRQASEAGIALMKKATERCNAETMKLNKMFGTMEIRSHNMVTTVVETMANQVADKMRDRMVIVERQYNRRALWRRAAVLLAAVLAIFSVGCGAMRYADRHAVRLWDKCFEHPYSDRVTGAQWCDVGAPLAEK